MKSWRDQLQPHFVQALNDADRLKLTGKDRERFVRSSSPPWAKDRNTWPFKVWQSMVRQEFKAKPRSSLCVLRSPYQRRMFE